MNHDDHVRLLRPGVPSRGGVWADFGSGTGAFTLALADLIGNGGMIYSVDRDASALRRQKAAMQERFPEVRVTYQVADFAMPLSLPKLNGAVMANSLHFHRQKEDLIRLLRGYLEPGARFILVEYDVDSGNPWVPYPISFHTWEGLSLRCGFSTTMLLETVPSRFLGRIYSAASW